MIKCDWIFEDFIGCKDCLFVFILFFCKFFIGNFKGLLRICEFFVKNIFLCDWLSNFLIIWIY